MTSHHAKFQLDSSKRSSYPIVKKYTTKTTPIRVLIRVGGGYSELGLFGTPWYIFDILSTLPSPIFWLFNIDIEGMILVYHCCMMVVLLLQLQLQQQIKIARFRLVKVTNANNFGFSLTFFHHQIPWIIFTYHVDILKLECTKIFQ